MAENSVYLVSKCQNFLIALIRLVGDQTTETASNVKKLIQNLINGITEPEEFSTQLQKELNCSFQTYLTDFLKKSLPHLRQALTSGEMAIEGIHPPPVPASIQNLVPTTQVNVPHIPEALISREMTTEGSWPPPVPTSIQNLVPTTQRYLPPIKAESPPVRNIQSSDSVPVPGNAAEPPVLRSQPKFQEMLQDVTSDIKMGKAITYYLETKVDPKVFEKPFSQPEVAHVMHIRDFRKDFAMNKKLNRKLKCLCKDNSSNLKEYKQLHHDVGICIKKEREKKVFRQIAKFNNFCVELKTVWAGDGCVSYLPADKEPSAIASKDAVFDMSSLDECLPGDDAQKKVKKIVKDYLSYEERQKQFFRRSEILRILVASAFKKNKKEPSVSSKQSITRMVKKVYGDVKNVRIFSFRSVLKNGKEIDGKVSLKEQGKKTNFILGKEKIFLMKSPCTRNDKTKNYKPADKNASDLTSKPANLRNPERLLFNRDQRGDEQHGNASLRKQEMQDSISLCRQLSRLKITNSKRDGISEDISESEIQKVCKDQNKDKLGKASVTIRKKQVIENLRKEHQSHGAKTTTDRCPEDKDVPRTINSTYDKPGFSRFRVDDNNPIFLPFIASMRNANLALTPGGSGSIFPSTSGNSMAPMKPITPSSAGPFIGPQLQKNELEELME